MLGFSHNRSRDLGEGTRNMFDSVHVRNKHIFLYTWLDCFKVDGHYFIKLAGKYIYMISHYPVGLSS